MGEDEHDYNTTNDNIDGGSETSEPPGEGVEADYVDYIVDGIDDGGGGQYIDFLLFCQNPTF